MRRLGNFMHIIKLYPSCQGRVVSVMIVNTLNMELTSPILNTLKINSKKGYILIDPDSSEDAKIIVLSDGSTMDIAQTPDNLVIFGPGDFEASGILIKGTRQDSETIYSIDTGDGRALLASSTSISKLTDEDDYDAVIIKAVAPVTESDLSSISSQLVVVYGDEANIPETVKTSRFPKINLRKKEELGSNLVYLEKK